MTNEQSQNEQRDDQREPRRVPIPLADRRRLLDKVLTRDEKASAIKDWASI